MMDPSADSEKLDSNSMRDRRMIWPFVIAYSIIGCAIALRLGYLNKGDFVSHHELTFAYSAEDANTFIELYDGWLLEQGFEKVGSTGELDSLSTRYTNFYAGTYKDSQVFFYQVDRRDGGGAWRVTDLQTWPLGRVSSKYRAEMKKLSDEFQDRADQWMEHHGLKVVDPR